MRLRLIIAKQKTVYLTTMKHSSSVNFTFLKFSCICGLLHWRTRRRRKVLLVIVTNTSGLIDAKSISSWQKDTAQARVFMLFLPETLLTLIKEHWTITTHNTNQHCRVHFYACVRQSLLKQLYEFRGTYSYEWDTRVDICNKGRPLINITGTLYQIPAKSTAWNFKFLIADKSWYWFKPSGIYTDCNSWSHWWFVRCNVHLP